MSTQQAVLAFYALFLGVAMVWPSLRVWRQTGVNPLVLPRDDSAEGFVGLAFKLTVGGLGLYLVCLAAEWLDPVGMIDLPAPAARHTVGWLLVGLSLAWVVIAQYQMGRSWRVGIDRANATALVRHGLFRFSRNPIFLGMMVQLAGLLGLARCGGPERGRGRLRADLGPDPAGGTIPAGLSSGRLRKLCRVGQALAVRGKHR